MNTIVTGCLALLLCASSAVASSKELPYAVETVFPAGVRYLRVDRDFPVLEADKDNGYAIFTFVSPAGKKSRGTLEVVRRGDDKAPRVLVTFTLIGLPGYLEDELHAGLRSKLRHEQGK